MMMNLDSFRIMKMMMMSMEDGERYLHEKAPSPLRVRRLKQLSHQAMSQTQLKHKRLMLLLLTGVATVLHLQSLMVNETIRHGVNITLLFQYGVYSEETLITTNLM